MGVVLASNSPRRRELLRYVVSDYTVHPANVDETVPPNLPTEQCAEYVARQKALAVAKEFPNDLVIGCDTVVLHGGNVLGKPSSEEEAFNTLKSLSGDTHSVVTGVCIANGGDVTAFSEVTEVTFYELTDREILDYIATGEPSDKAGSYGIQGYGSLLVKCIRGDCFNVVGLPISRLNRVLKTMDF
jgi:septum formation protein